MRSREIQLQSICSLDKAGRQAAALSLKTLVYVPACILRVLTAFENGVDSLR
jgi:hypothetical protein